MAKLHRSQFIKEVKETWPHLAPDINSEYGLLHLEMSVFARFTQQMIDAGNREELIRCFKVALKYEVGGNAKVRNAIDVSFVEDLEFGDSRKHRRSWAWEVLPERLRELYVDFHGKPNL